MAAAPMDAAERARRELAARETARPIVRTASARQRPQPRLGSVRVDAPIVRRATRGPITRLAGPAVFARRAGLPHQPLGGATMSVRPIGSTETGQRIWRARSTTNDVSDLTSGPPKTLSAARFMSLAFPAGLTILTRSQSPATESYANAIGFGHRPSFPVRSADVSAMRYLRQVRSARQPDHACAARPSTWVATAERRRAFRVDNSARTCSAFRCRKAAPS